MPTHFFFQRPLEARGAVLLSRSTPPCAFPMTRPTTCPSQARGGELSLNTHVEERCAVPWPTRPRHVHHTSITPTLARVWPQELLYDEAEQRCAGVKLWI